MFIMFNPSNGGNKEEDKADTTINRILRAADANMFGGLEYGEKWSGVYIRNLFTFRSAKPSEVKVEFKREIEKFKNMEENKDKKGKEFDKACREFAQKKLQVGCTKEDWVQTASDCHRIIIAWGDCGHSKDIQIIKDEVIHFTFLYIFSLLSKS